MRFALVGPVYPYRGGIAHYTTMLYRALRERGHDVLLISFKRQYPQWLFPGRSDKDPSKEPLEVEDAQYWIDSLNPITWLTTFWRVSRYGPDAVILQWWTTFWGPVWTVIGILTRLLLRKPIAFICHNVLPHKARWYDSFMTKLALRWGTRFLVQSDDEKELLLSLLSDIQVTTTPLPVFDMFSHRQIPKVEARRKLGLPSNVPTMLFFGIVRDYKGLKDLIAAVPRVREQLGEMTLVVAGEFWEDKRPYTKMVDRLNLGGSVIFEDRYILNEEVPIYFSAADLVVAPYQRVTGSGAVRMAQSFGIPVITTWEEQQLQDYAEGRAELVVPPGNVGALEAAIIDFFESDRMLETPQEASDKQGFRWSSLARLIEEVAA